MDRDAADRHVVPPPAPRGSGRFDSPTRQQGRRSLALISLAFSVAALGLGAGVIGWIYRAALAREQLHLTHLVQSQARVLEAMGSTHPAAAAAGALDALSGLLSGDDGTGTGFGRTGEFVVARRDGDAIVFLTRGRDGLPVEPLPARGPLGEPMRRALAGEAGVMVGLDYEGARVLAAYERVESLDLGLVAKIELQEVRTPLVRAALVVAAVWLLVVAAGSALYAWANRRLRGDLAASRRSVLELFEASQLGTLLIGEERIERANARACELLERDAEEIVGRSLADFSTPRQPDGSDSQTVARELLAEALAGRRQRFDWQLLRPGGALLDVEVAVTAIHLEDRRRLQLSLRDVSLRRRREELERRLMAILENTTDGVVMASADGRLLYVNPAGRRLLEIPEEEVGTHRITDFQDPSLVRRILGGASTHGVWEGENELRSAGGRIVPVSQVAIAHRDAAGAVEYFSTIFRDRSAEREAEAQRRRLVAAIEQLDEAIVVTDTQGIIEFVNRAFERITGYAAEEALGSTTRLLRSGHQTEAFYRDLWTTIQEGRVWSGELVNRRKDGTFYEEEMTISPVADERGEIVNFVAVKRDVTQARLLEAQFLQAQKMEAVGRLAAGVAHDFNNVLTGILGHAELLLEQAAEGEGREDLRRIVELSRRAADLTRQLLAFSRREPEAQTALEIDDWVEGTLGMLRRVISEDIVVELDRGAANAAVRSDPAQLLQVLMNLVVNARDAMPGGGRLRIATAVVSAADGEGLPSGLRPGRYVELAVADTGHGMDAGILERVFEPFFTTKQAGEGSGLGLSTVRGIVASRGGVVTATSAVGRGSTFTVYLPLSENAIAAPAGAPEAGAVPRTAHATILLVEDDPAVCRIIERTLTGADYTVLVASGPAEARRLLRDLDEPVDLMVTDLVMPGGTGVELYEEVAADHRGLHVLFISGYSEVPRLLELEASVEPEFLGKPFTPAELLRRVASILGPQGAA